MFAVEVLLTENELAEQLRIGLEKRYLPEKFFYWLPLSVKAWLELCQASQPYRNYSRSYQLVAKHAREIAEHCSGRSFELVSLGAGQGDKDFLLLEALRHAGCQPRYRPVDSSQSLLELAAGRAARAGFLVAGLKADLDDPRTANVLACAAGSPRLYAILGNTLGVIDPLGFLEMLGRLLRQGDRLLLDGELFDPEDTLAGYDNPVNRRFAFAPLASLGLEEGRDGSLVFETATDARLGSLHLVTKHFRATRKLEIPVGEQRVAMAAGETIAMNSSYKYTRAVFLNIVREHGGFQVLRECLSDDGQFLMVLAAPAGPATVP